MSLTKPPVSILDPAIATKSGTEVLTNKDIDGGTASNTSRITLPKANTATLAGLTRKEGTIVYDTAQKKAFCDDGANLIPFGSGSGSANLIPDGDAESGITNYIEGSYTAASRPSGAFTPSSGASALSISTSTTNPLSGTTSFLITKTTGASRQGRAVERTINLDQEYRTKVLKTKIKVRIVSGSFVVGTNGTSPVDSSLIWYVAEYNGTTWTYKEPSNFKMLSSSTTISDTVSGEFQVNFDTTQIKVIAYCAESASSAWVVQCEIGVEPSVGLSGSINTNWVSYTPTLTSSGGGTITLNATSSTPLWGRWRQDGDSIEINYGFRNGTGSAATGVAGNLKIDFPPGVVFDTEVQSSISDGVLGNYLGPANTSSSTPNIASYQVYSGFISIGQGSGSLITLASLGAGVSINGWAKFKVKGWSSSVQMSDSANTRIVGATQGSSLAQSIPSGVYTPVDFPSVIANDTHGGWEIGSGYNSATGTWTIQPGYRVKVGGRYTPRPKMLFAQATWASGTIFDGAIRINGVDRLGIDVQQLISSGTTYVALKFSEAGLDLKVNDFVQVVIFHNQGANRSLHTGNTQVIFSIDMANGPAAIAASETINARYLSTGSQTFSAGAATTISYTTPSSPAIDSHGSWNGTQFKAKIAGLYDVRFIHRTTTNTGTSTNYMQLYKNTSTFVSEKEFAQSLTSLATSWDIDDLVYLKADETIECKFFNGMGTTVTQIAGLSNNRVRIIKVGN